MQFFVLEGKVGSEAETGYEPVDKQNFASAPVCPVCGRYSGMMYWLPPYRVILRSYGAKIGDIAFDTGSDVLLSHPFLSAWRAEALKGLGQVEPVEIMKVRPERLKDRIPAFYHARIDHTGVQVDWTRSVIRPERSCKLCGGGGCDAIEALRIDEKTWNGEDIFVPWGCYDIIVTENVVRLARKHSLANVTTVPIEQYSWDPLQ